MMNNTIFTLNELVEKRQKLKTLKKKVVFTNGCFDIIHRGHIEYLQKAKSLGDFLIVGLNTDESVKIIKEKGRPVINEGDRAVILSEFKSVDAVCFFNEHTPIELIKALQPDVLVKGADYKVDEIVGYKEVIASGGEVIPIELTEGRSTSSIISKIKSIE